MPLLCLVFRLCNISLPILKLLPVLFYCGFYTDLPKSSCWGTWWLFCFHNDAVRWGWAQGHPGSFVVEQKFEPGSSMSKFNVTTTAPSWLSWVTLIFNIEENKFSSLAFSSETANGICSYTGALLAI